MAAVSKSRVYAVVTRYSGCKLWYVNIDDGSEHYLTKDPEILSPGVLGSSPELDNEENIYVADGFNEKPDGVYSFDKMGTCDGIHPLKILGILLFPPTGLPLESTLPLRDL